MVIDMQQGLTVRTQPKGGQLAKHVHPIGLTSTQLAAAQRLVLLIHGYNTDLTRAQADYRALLQNLAKDSGIESYTSDLFLGFFWPGDRENRLTSTSSYPWKIDIAIAAGRCLGSWLARLNKHLKIVIIAHSLGCRVALEAISHMYVAAIDEDKLPPTVSGVCLMAAAVPTRMCRPKGGQFGARYKKTAEHVLYSPKDVTLGLSFLVGQKLGGEGEWGSAVGFFGQPSKRWDPRRKNTWLSHGDYFDSEIASDVAGSLLDSRAPRKRETQRPAESHLTTHRFDANAPETRSLADPSTWICSCALGP